MLLPIHKSSVSQRFDSYSYTKVHEILDFTNYFEDPPYYAVACPPENLETHNCICASQLTSILGLSCHHEHKTTRGLGWCRATSLPSWYTNSFRSQLFSINTCAKRGRRFSGCKGRRIYDCIEHFSGESRHSSWISLLYVYISIFRVVIHTNIN